MRKTFAYASKVACGTALALSFASTGAFAATDMDKEMMMELKRLIEQQQEQLAKQAKEIEALKQSVGGVNVAMEEKVSKKDFEAMGGAQPSSLMNSKFENVDVTFYGQVNKAIMFADNGNSSKTYFVDNANSSTRLGLDASVGVSEDFKVGGKVEYEFKSNASNVVNEIDDTSNADFNLRHADIFFTSTRYGKVSLGKGSMASDGTSEVDLSGTSLVTYMSVSDMAGGQLWNENAGLTDVSIGDVYSDFDGGREDRIRYDTPSYYGFMGSVSAATSDNYDFALRYSREYDYAKVAAAVAYQNRGADSAVDDIFNGSLSVLWSNGFNVTLAGGVRSAAEAGRDDASFYGGKLGYQASIFDFGKTAFSVDYIVNDDVYENDGEADTWSLGVVQNVPDWGTEFYFAYRQHMYDAPTKNYDDVNVIMTGARLRF